jgi:hypothetical protein
VTVAADPTPGRVLQYSLLALLPAAGAYPRFVARLAALMSERGSGRPRRPCRPGAFG